MPPKGRDHNPSGLGRAIINRKVKDAQRMHETKNYSVDDDKTGKLKSVTQEKDLDEFLNTAQLAGTDFTAERRNVKIITPLTGSSRNPHLLTEEEERSTIKKHSENKEKLRVPRRPAWKKSMTPAELDRQEKDAFLDWRRGLAQLQENQTLLLTPFERNLEVWRQMWRVIERSHLVVQIVDARNPSTFRCEDLDAYVKDVEGPEGEHGSGEGHRRSLLLINKADMLTAKQRCQWADYLDSQGIRFAFFSAANSAAIQQLRREEHEAALAAAERGDDAESGPEDESDEEDSESEEEDEDADEAPSSDEDSDSDKSFFSIDEEPDPALQDPRARVLSVLELEDLFMRMAPPLTDFTDSDGKAPTKLTVGLVGYPNVGKSSTINALLGEKKVSVSSTPGKTKHFQTIHLSESIILCDCPGLVFPQFANTKSHLVCDGVLPIDQMRDYIGPISLLVSRIPDEVLERTYGLSVPTKPIDEGGDGNITPEGFLISYAVARGYTRAGQGNPDEARAARYILKDYVNGRLLFCVPPPGLQEAAFNEETHKNALLRAEGKKQAPLTRVGKHADTFVNQVFVESGEGPARSHKAVNIDQKFFESDGLSSRAYVKGNQAFPRGRLYPHQNAVADDGTPLGSRHAHLASVLAAGGMQNGKKGHKKPKREKKRSGRGYDD
ncbi:P-loop containing nucleoside triphosphate hydrolase protein [Pterulicium gracile]|uniref:P-loop containing nucleoside triphosphate hydrolase protein n=1 Tax=Pterulicium gracile TaxID=1884261 RepID=A0A5C3QWD6_9AGAR|nr:P-loop containing nucleoside triphosphate hydrolase protein [Pterula gracilis]